MKNLISGLALAAALAVAACAGGKITPAQGTLYGCDAFATALDVVNPLIAAGKVSEANQTIVVKARDMVAPVCLGSAPDLNASIKSTVIDAGTKMIQAVTASILGGT